MRLSGKWLFWKQREHLGGVTMASVKSEPKPRQYFDKEEDMVWGDI